MWKQSPPSIGRCSVPRKTELLGFLRQEGLTVIETNGWKTRGSETFDPEGSVNHHTAGAASGIAPSLNICINGRAGIPGPLCHVLQSRATDPNGLDVLYLVAAGRANHAGTGGWKGLSGNSKVFGLEIEHVGTTAEPFSVARRETAVRVHAAFAKCAKFTSDTVCQHLEWTSRKVDFVKALLDPNGFRLDVSNRLHPPIVPPVQEDDVLSCPVPWILPSFGREAYFRIFNGPVDGSINIVSKNGAPLDKVPVLRGGQYVPGGVFSPGMKDDKGRVVDSVAYGFWVRTLYDTLGNADGVWLSGGGMKVTVSSTGGGTYVIASK